MPPRRWLKPLLGAVIAAASTAAAIVASLGAIPRGIPLYWTLGAAGLSAILTFLGLSASHSPSPGVARSESGEQHAESLVGRASAAHHASREAFGANLLTSAWLSVGALLVLAVWFRSGGTIGKVVDVGARTLLGMGAYALPALAIAVGIASLAQPNPGLGHLGQRFSRWRGSVSTLTPRTGLVALRWMLRRGFTLVAIASVGLLHIVRFAPPVGAPIEQLQRSAGIAGALVVTPVMGILGLWGAAILLSAMLLHGAFTVAEAAYRRRGAFAASVVLTFSLVVPAAASYFLYDYDYDHWVVLDGKNLVVVKGLGPQRSRLVQGTDIRRERIPTAFQVSLEHGIAAYSREDGLRLARLAPHALDLPGDAKGYMDGRSRLQPGACLTDEGTPTVCSVSHSEEIYRVLGLPYSKYPGEMELQRLGAEACRHWYKSFTKISPERSSIAFAAHTPSLELWNQGNRSVACAIKHSSRRSLRGQRVVFEDGFSDPGNWDSSYFDPLSCDYEFKRGQLTLSATEAYLCPTSAAEVEPGLPDDLTVEFTLHLKHGRHDGGGIELDYDNDWEDEGHFFVIQEDGLCWIAKDRKGKWYLLEDQRVTFRPGSSLRVKVTRRLIKQNTLQLQLSVNGHLCVGAEDDVKFDEETATMSRDGRFPKTTVRMVAGDITTATARASFDHVVIAALR